LRQEGRLFQEEKFEEKKIFTGDLGLEMILYLRT